MNQTHHATDTSKPPMSSHPLLTAGCFLLYGIAFALGVTVAGGLLFGLMFPLVGPLFGYDHEPLTLATIGYLTGVEYFGKVWAIGGAVVFCFILGHRIRKKQQTGDPNQPDTAQPSDPFPGIS